MSDVIDLTEESCIDDPPIDQAFDEEVIGAELSADVVDLVGESDDDDVHGRLEAMARKLFEKPRNVDYTDNKKQRPKKVAQVAAKRKQKRKRPSTKRSSSTIGEKVVERGYLSSPAVEVRDRKHRTSGPEEPRAKLARTSVSSHCSVSSNHWPCQHSQPNREGSFSQERSHPGFGCSGRAATPGQRSRTVSLLGPTDSGMSDAGRSRQEQNQNAKSNDTVPPRAAYRDVASKALSLGKAPTRQLAHADTSSFIRGEPATFFNAGGSTYVSWKYGCKRKEPADAEASDSSQLLRNAGRPPSFEWSSGARVDADSQQPGPSKQGSFESSNGEEDIDFVQMEAAALESIPCRSSSSARCANADRSSDGPPLATDGPPFTSAATHGSPTRLSTEDHDAAGPTLSTTTHGKGEENGSQTKPRDATRPPAVEGAACSSEERIATERRPPAPKIPQRKSPAAAAAAPAKGKKKEPPTIATRRFIIIDSDSETEGPLKKPWQSRRPRAHASKNTNSKRRLQEKQREWTSGLTHDDAQQLQDKLLRDAATKMKQQAPRIHVHIGIPKIDQPITDVETRYPNHWQWKDPCARLGLPSDASLRTVKTQYRRLARLYHPDKSRDPDASRKFQSIASAYKLICDSTRR